ncbi:MAG: hypothetical protein HC933_09255 [Pleurocapsa sp. SU_196_0]|nr:hypothetical protein [Pleurocapsa sp. SU_196_0]
MTELLWIALGLVIGALAGWLYPRPQKKRVVRDTDETAALRGQLGRVQSELENARLEVARAHANREASERQIKELSARLPRLEGFERVNADLRLQMQGFDTVKQKLEAASEQLDAAKPKLAEFDALNARLEATTAELSTLKIRTAGFESLQSRAGRVEELEAKLTALEVEKSKLLKEANDAALKASDADAAQRKIRLALDEAIAEVARTRDGMRRFETLQTRIEQLEAQGINPEAQARLETLERDLETARATVATLQVDQNAKLELQQSQLRVLDLERQLVTLPGLKDELHTRNAELTAARDRVAQLDAAFQRIETLETALKATEGELERFRGTAAPLTESQG